MIRDDRPATIEVTENARLAAVAALRDRYCCEWGGRDGMSETEAMIVVDELVGCLVSPCGADRRRRDGI